MAIGAEGAEGMFGDEYEEGVDDGYGEEEGEGDGEPGEGNDMFQALAANPNFALIRQRILQDPSFYQ